MTGLSPVFWLCLAWIGVVLAVGLAPQLRASSSVAGFVAADRTMDTVVLYFLLAGAIFSAFAFLGMPGWAYARGAAAYYVLAYGAFGLLPMYFIGPKARRVGLAEGFVTPGEMLGWRFESRTLSVVVAALTVVALVPYLTLQMKGAGYILDIVSEGRVPPWLGMLLAYGAVTLYVVLGGVAAVGWTNVLQSVVMALVAWGVGLYLPQVLYGGIGPMFEQLARADAVPLVPPGLDGTGADWGWAAYSSAILISVIGFSCWPHFFMRAFAARSDLSFKRIVVWYPTYTIFLLPILLIGFAAVLRWPGISPSDAVVPFVLFNSGLPWVITAVMCIGVLAASMSTGDAIMHAAGSVAVRDGIRVAHPLDDAREHRAMQAVILLFALLAYGLALAEDISLVALLLASYGAIAQLFPVLIAAFYWRGATGRGIVAGLLVGIAVDVVLLAWPGLRPWPVHEGLYGLAANVATMVVVSRWSVAPAAARIERFIEDRLD